MTLWENLLMALVEGITEYLPISSTGHLIIASTLLKLQNTDNYIIAIQFGAILAVIVTYYKRFLNFKSFDFYLKLIAGFIPAAILGFLLDDYLEALLQKPMIVGVVLVIVGIFLLYIDKLLPGGERKIEDLSYMECGLIGLFQCVAMIPGVSRSAASITGGLFTRLNKVEATEFSFFLAVPTLSAAALYKVLKNFDTIAAQGFGDIIIGNVISFFVALLAIRFFINLVKNKGFAWFGWYRIVVGIAFIAYLLFNN